MLSRGMIFNSLSIAWGIFRKKKYKDNYLFNSIHIVSIIFLFFLGIKLIGDLRIEGNKKTVEYCENINVSKTVYRSSFDNNPAIQNKYLKILVSRLIGIEGVMAVQSLDNKSFALILESLKEKTSLDKEISFFDSLKNDQRCNNRFSKSITLPGIIAFLYYSGSMVFVSISLILITITMCLIEKIMRILLGEQLLFISLVSQILAYRMWHFGFAPLNSIKLFFAIFITTILVYFLNKLFMKNIK